MTQEPPEKQAASLVNMQRWIALATTDDQGAPHISYTPFACVLGAFGIAVSRLAQHTAHLLAARPAAVLLVGGNTEQPDPYQWDPYARIRLSIDVLPRRCPPGSASARELWAALEGRHGETVAALRTLTDFEAIALDPLRGRLVLGFASAHDLDETSIREMLSSGR